MSKQEQRRAPVLARLVSGEMGVAEPGADAALATLPRPQPRALRLGPSGAKTPVTDRSCLGSSHRVQSSRGCQIRTAINTSVRPTTQPVVTRNASI